MTTTATVALTDTSPPQLDLFTVDDDFGEFEFVLPPADSILLCPQPPLLDEEVADEWSDFVESPLEHPAPPPPYSSFPDLVKYVWKKPNGAFPLSIFGEEDEEEDADQVDPANSLTNSGNKNSSLTATSSMKNSGSQAGSDGVVITKDLILDLYGADSSVCGNHEDFNDENGWEFRDAVSELFSDGNGGQRNQSSSRSGFGQNMSLMADLFSVEDKLTDENDIEKFSPSSVANADGHGDVEDSVWEFKAAPSDLHKGDSFVRTQCSEKPCKNDTANLSASSFGEGKQEPDIILISQSCLAVKSASFWTTKERKSAFSHLSDNLVSNSFDEVSVVSTVNFRQNIKYGQDSARLACSNNMKGFGCHDRQNHSDIDQSLFEDRTKNLDSLSVDELERFTHFYYTLKCVSYYLILDHLDDMKRAREISKVCGEEMRAIDLNMEIKAAQLKLQGEYVETTDCHWRDNFVKLHQFMRESPVQAFEIEYLLSEKLAQAEKNLVSAIHLFDHAILVLHLTNMISWKEQQTFVIAWSKLLFSCAQELDLGSMIWTQCHNACVWKEIFSTPQGYDYFVALGEIYRVVQVLKASLTVYRPWILLHSRESCMLRSSLMKCAVSWADPGLKTAIEYLLDQPDSNNKEEVKALVESINFINDLDTLTIQNGMLANMGPICGLSLLPHDALQDMKTIIWDGNVYFLKLANMWVNQISCDHPKMPCKSWPLEKIKGFRG